MLEKLTIGWTLIEQTGSILFPPPEPLFSLYEHKSEGLSSCPAVQHYEHRVFFIRSPYTFQIHAEHEKNQWYFYPVYPFTDMPEDVLFEYVQFQPCSAWRNPFIPVLQLVLPYIFVSDEDVFMNQIESPSFRKKNWSLISGRFNIYEWQRPINWAVSWVDTQTDLIVRRGDLLFSMLFEDKNPTRSISLTEIQYSDSLKSLVESSKNVSTHIRGTFRLLPLQREKRKGKEFLKTKKEMEK